MTFTIFPSGTMTLFPSERRRVHNKITTKHTAALKVIGYMFKEKAFCVSLDKVTVIEGKHFFSSQKGKLQQYVDYYQPTHYFICKTNRTHFNLDKTKIAGKHHVRVRIEDKRNKVVNVSVPRLLFQSLKKGEPERLKYTVLPDESLLITENAHFFLSEDSFLSWLPITKGAILRRYRRMLAINRKKCTSTFISIYCPVAKLMKATNFGIDLYSLMTDLGIDLGNQNEILYLGKFEKGISRFEKHPHLNAIALNEGKDYDILIYLFSLNVFMDFFVFNQEIISDFVIGDKKLTALKEILIAEAMLINYFQPKYNINFKKTLSTKTSAILKALDEKRFTKLWLYIEVDGIMYRFGTLQTGFSNIHQCLFTKVAHEWKPLREFTLSFP